MTELTSPLLSRLLRDRKRAREDHARHVASIKRADRERVSQERAPAHVRAYTRWARRLAVWKRDHAAARLRSIENKMTAELWRLAGDGVK